jgi:large subunit ribosomal protein L10
MRADKLALSNEYVARLNHSPFFILVDYRGLTVKHFGELRQRLAKAGAEVHVVKNSIFRFAAEATGIPALAGTLTGQLAAVTGQKDIATAAKILKSFRAEFEKPQIKFGFLNHERIEAADLLVLADLPPLDELRGRLIGMIQAPASRLVRLLCTPAQQLTRAIQQRVEKGV